MFSWQHHCTLIGYFSRVALQKCHLKFGSALSATCGLFSRLREARHAYYIAAALSGREWRQEPSSTEVVSSD